jgi:hypothetical protein
LEGRIDNLQMDMTSVELLVVNAHQQVQCVEDEVVVPLLEKVSGMYHDFFTTMGAVEEKLEACCEKIQHSCVVVMDSLVCLEKGIKENTDEIV